MALFLLPMVAGAQQQNLTNRGHVMDEAGNPFWGANVYPEGMMFGEAKRIRRFLHLCRGHICEGYKMVRETITLRPDEITVDFSLQVDVRYGSKVNVGLQIMVLIIN